jgi:hypothetical protein
MSQEPKSIEKLVSDWMNEYPNGTHILLWEQYILKAWQPGVITGFNYLYGRHVLEFRLDTDKPKIKPRIISYENRELLKKE